MSWSLNDNYITALFIAGLGAPFIYLMVKGSGAAVYAVCAYGLWLTLMVVYFIRREIQTYGDKAGEQFRIWKKEK